LLALLLAVAPISATQSDQRLVDASKAQDHELVSALVAQRADVNDRQADGATALHWAAHWDALDTADLLIGAGADVDAANDYGVTPLALACENGAGAMVARLLEAGANPNAARSTGETPLMTCARTGNPDAVRALLSRGAHPGASEPWHDQTALMWAAAEGHTEVARALIEDERGVDIDARSSGGFTALLIAAREDEPELVQVLLDAGADVNATAPDGTTPLVVATVRGHSALATTLLEQGADPNADGTGYTALHWASGAWHTELTGRLRGIATARDDEWRSLNEVPTGKLDLVEALLAHGADPHARLVRSPPQFGYASGRFRVSLVGATPFLLAAMDGNVAVMRALAAAGADPMVGTDELTTPLMVAAGLGQVPAETRVIEGDSLAAVTFVLELGADVNAINDVGRAALHGAAHIRSDAIVQLLADRGARVNVEDRRGITPLMIAEGGGHILLPGLGGGSTADLLRALGSDETSPSSFIENFSQGVIR
jgi:ankyrin repeat protein